MSVCNILDLHNTSMDDVENEVGWPFNMQCPFSGAIVQDSTPSMWTCGAVHAIDISKVSDIITHIECTEGEGQHVRVMARGRVLARGLPTRVLLSFLHRCRIWLVSTAGPFSARIQFRGILNTDARAAVAFTRPLIIGTRDDDGADIVLDEDENVSIVGGAGAADPLDGATPIPVAPLPWQPEPDLLYEAVHA